MVSPAIIVEGWEVEFCFCRGAIIPHWPLCWRAHSERSHPRLMLLGVRLNIEVGGCPAVRALAACSNTQLTCTDTSLRPHKHLFAEQKKPFHTSVLKHLSHQSFWLSFHNVCQVEQALSGWRCFRISLHTEMDAFLCPCFRTEPVPWLLVAACHCSRIGPFRTLKTNKQIK